MCMNANDEACGPLPFDGPSPTSSNGQSQTHVGGMCGKCLSFWMIVLIAAITSLLVFSVKE